MQPILCEVHLFNKNNCGMKKYILNFVLVLMSIPGVNAQNISNPSFDSVYFGGIDRVFEWITSDGFMIASGFNNDTILPLTSDTIYDASGFQFSEVINGIWLEPSPFSQVAVRLSNNPDLRTINNDFYETSIVNGLQFKTNSMGYIDYKSCGSPFQYRPTKLKGKYKFEDSLSLVQNYGKCMILLKKYNTTNQEIDTIAYNYNATTFIETNGWVDFEIPLNYVSNLVPDSIVIAFFSSVEFNSESALFFVDELSFEFEPMQIIEEDIDIESTLYPNPSTDIIYLDKINFDYDSFQLMTIDGRVLLSGQATKALSIAEYANQVLILQLRSKNGQYKTYRLIKG